MTARTIPLSDPSLEAEIRSLDLDGVKLEGLWFTCPICSDHLHVIPFERGVAAGRNRLSMNVWGHTGGSDLSDLTLAPSYLARHRRAQMHCRLHLFIRDGSMQILGDSGLS